MGSYLEVCELKMLRQSQRGPWVSWRGEGMQALWPEQQSSLYSNIS